MLKKLTDARLFELWSELKNIPINDEDEILEEFHIFEAGTHRFEIWQWFDANYSQGVAVLSKTKNRPMQHYHRHYNNDSYRAIQIALISDLYDELAAENVQVREQLLSEEIPNTIMNLLTDVALEISGVPTLSGKQHILLNQILEHQLSSQTIRLMGEHLDKFEQSGTFARDFEEVALTVLNISKSQETILDAVSVSSAIQGPHGRGAHYLLKASTELLEIAQLLLFHESSQAYMSEKMNRAEKAFVDAQKEILAIYNPAKTGD